MPLPFPILEVRPNSAGRYYWRLRSRNGKIVETSGQSFSRKRDAVRAATRTQELMACAVLEVK